MTDDQWNPVSPATCERVTGPFYHGTKEQLAVGAELTPGYGSNYEAGRVSNHVYFSSKLEPAMWGAQLACALSGRAGPGHVYVVEPLGPFEDDPNLTNKRFAGNPTQSFRTQATLRIVAELTDWQPHPESAVREMLARLAELRRTGQHVIED
jgi:rifampin ADP-ribosylating transferase